MQKAKLTEEGSADRDEPNVTPDSNVETYVAMELGIDSWRWASVPFYVRTGKHLSQRLTEIAIRFKQAPHAAFEDTPVDALRPNWLVLRIAPEFLYDDWFPKEQNVGYQTLLYDVKLGDQTFFMRADMIEQAWRVVQAVLDDWTATKVDFPNHDSGSSGPGAADALLSGDRAWRPVALPPGAKA